MYVTHKEDAVKEFKVVPIIRQYEESKSFCEDFAIGRGDLVITSESTYYNYFENQMEGALVIFRGNYQKGEPSDEMVEKIYEDVKDYTYRRVFAIGGGSVLDVAKLFALRTITPVVDLFEKKIDIKKTKKLILVPTTCGTGSEVTNISILELKSRHTKMGLAVDELYADYAVLIPELLNNLPFSFFATSSIDALIHAVESYMSPKASLMTEIYSIKAINIILKGYQIIAKNGPEARKDILTDFLIASTYAGIAFGNAGCAAVHAMSYPLGSTYHVPHGEANYAIFTGVYYMYQKLQPVGKIEELNKILSNLLECSTDTVYEKLEELLNHIIQKKSLREYGMKKCEIADFTNIVMKEQGRLMANNYTELSERCVTDIYEKLY